MKLPKFHYVRPESIVDACSSLQAPGAVAIAGGTDLLPPLRNRLRTAEVLVDLKGLAGLRQISYSQPGGLTLGALVSLRQLADSPLVREKYPGLALAALQVASPQIRAMGTVGGNICQDSLCLYHNRSASGKNGFEPCLKMGGEVCHTVRGSKLCWATACSDLAPVLLVLQARVKVSDCQGERIMSLQDLYSRQGTRPTSLPPGQLITEVRVPEPEPGQGITYLKLRTRNSLDYPLLGAAVKIFNENGRDEKASLALTGVGKVPLILEDLGKGGLDSARVEELAETAYKLAHPQPNQLGPAAEYRREMVKVYVRRAIHELRGGGGDCSWKYR